MNNWFAYQAMIPGERGAKRVQDLMNHSKFSLENPNRARSLIGSFVMGNPTGFNLPDGSGYRFFVDQIHAMDAINPQMAARVLTAMGSWRRLEPKRKEQAKQALQSLASKSNLSRDVQEIVDRTLQ